MDQKTIDAYDRLAKEYDDETIDFWKEFPHTFISAFAKLVPGKTVVNVGSGPGRDSALLQNEGLAVTGLDASAAMVALENERGLRSLLGDFAAMPFEPASFDGAWAYTSLLHVPKNEAPKILQEIRRVLKSNGILVLGLIEGETEEYRESSGMNMPRWFSFYTKEETEHILSENGFTVLHCEEYKPRSKNYLHFLARKN